jgi:hypothetical protein
MTTIVGIFDNAQDVDNVTKRLAAAGFDGTAVYDEAIVAEDPDSVDPAVPTLAPGSAPEVVLALANPICYLGGTSTALYGPLRPI